MAVKQPSNDVLLTELNNLTKLVERDRSDTNKRLDKIEAKLVTRAEFEPVKSIVYGLVGLVLTSVIVALLALVIRSGV